MGTAWALSERHFYWSWGRDRALMGNCVCETSTCVWRVTSAAVRRKYKWVSAGRVVPQHMKIITHKWTVVIWHFPAPWSTLQWPLFTHSLTHSCSNRLLLPCNALLVPLRATEGPVSQGHFKLHSLLDQRRRSCWWWPCHFAFTVTSSQLSTRLFNISFNARIISTNQRETFRVHLQEQVTVLRCQLLIKLNVASSLSCASNARHH